MVAKSKKLKDEKAWVDKILKHCEIHSDYLHFINLRSNPRMWFGVADAKFEVSLLSCLGNSRTTMK